MVKIKFIFLFLICSLSFSQNEVLELPLNYHSTFYDGKESLAISNENTGELMIFVEDLNVSTTYLLNKNFEIISEVSFESLPNAFKNFIGYQININGSYSIFFTNNSQKKYGELNLDFSNKKAVINELDFKLKKEIYVESISFAGDFYMISVTKNSNDVNFYKYNEKGFSKKKTLSFEFLETGTRVKAHYHLTGLLGTPVKMDINTPNDIEITSKPNKIYVIDNQFVLTFDVFDDKTKVAIINPKDFDLNLLEFDKPILESLEDVNHNSYLYDGKIFQIKSSSNSMKFTVKDFENYELLKEITLNKEDSIVFKNTPILQEGPALIAGTKIREMEKTSKFLRKISTGDIGISAYKQDSAYKIVLGSKVEISNGGGGFVGPMGGFGGIPLGAIGPLSVSFNPTFFAYGGYSSSKSTHIDCLFDNNFEHIKGNISDNIFDRIKTFEELFNEKSTLGKIKLRNLFRHNEKLYFGYVNTYDKNYHLVEFLD